VLLLPWKLAWMLQGLWVLLLLLLLLLHCGQLHVHQQLVPLMKIGCHVLPLAVLHLQLLLLWQAAAHPLLTCCPHCALPALRHVTSLLSK
jgi:hypothetical protein